MTGRNDPSRHPLFKSSTSLPSIVQDDPVTRQVREPHTAMITQTAGGLPSDSPQLLQQQLVTEKALRRLHQLYQSRLESVYSRFAQTAANIAQDVTINAMGRSAQSATFVADRIAEIVRGSLFDEKEVVISQLSMQLAANASKLSALESERSFLRANLDHQAAASSEALQRTIVSQQQKAAAQHDVETMHQQALRTEIARQERRNQERANEVTALQNKIRGLEIGSVEETPGGTQSRGRSCAGYRREK